MVSTGEGTFEDKRRGGEKERVSYKFSLFHHLFCPRMYNHELDKEFDSTNALHVTKTSRLRYAGHMIKRPEDLPQRALFSIGR
jgi:hypothetical protein